MIICFVLYRSVVLIKCVYDNQSGLLFLFCLFTQLYQNQRPLANLKSLTYCLECGFNDKINDNYMQLTCLI